MALLPRHSLWDSVQCAKPITRRGLLFRLGCTHQTTTTYTRTDHRPGPGFASDTYEGTVCMACGKIITEKQVY